MSRTCQFAFAGRSGSAEWSFDEISLIVTPADGRPLVYPVQELAGIAGDGYSLELTVPGAAAPAAAGESAGAEGAGGGPAGSAEAGGGQTAALPRLSLAKLGAEGPTLLDALQRTWLVARAKALRLGGSGEGKPFSGMVAGMGGRGGSVGSPGSGAAEPGASQAGAAEPFNALLFEDVMVIAREGRDP